MRLLSACLLTVATLLGNTGLIAQDPTPDQRKYLLDRVDDVAIVQLYVDGFDQLSLREKTLIYHLSQAAIAGRDIYIDQRYR